MKSPLEYLADALNGTGLGDAYSLEAVVFDDDEGSPRDRASVGHYDFSCRPGGQWFYPAPLEARLLHKLQALGAELVVLDGLLVILDELVRPGAPFHRRIVNIHPGITRIESPYERRGAYATLDALHGARGQKVVNWRTAETTRVPVVDMTGTSFHDVDYGIDSGEVILDVLNTRIDPRDTILELRWNNFNNSLFPALHQGLAHRAGMPAA